MVITVIMAMVIMAMGRVPMHKEGLLFLLFFFLLYNNLWAKEIEAGASISSSLYYSDNIDSSATGREDFFLTVTPGINFQKDGSRVKSNLTYSATGFLYASHSDKDEIRHRLNATAESEIVKHSLFLDLDAGVSQQLLDPNRYSDGVSGSDNLTQTYTYGISPYWRKKWSKYAESVLRYNYNELKYDNSNLDDSRQYNVSFDVSSGRAFDAILWSLDYRHSETLYERNENNIADTIRLVLTHPYSRQLDFRFTTGYEDYGSTQVTPGDGWAFGIKWLPNARNILDLDIGRRFFGTAYKFDYEHKGKRLNWHLSYDEDITNQRDRIRSNGLGQVGVITTPIFTNQNQTELYLTRIGRSDLNYSYHKSTFQWGLYLERRYYEDADEEDEDSYGTDLSWGLRVGRKTTMNTSISWGFFNDVRANTSRVRTTLTWSLNRRITPNTSGYINTSFQNYDADTQVNSYTENRIGVGLTKQF